MEVTRAGEVVGFDYPGMRTNSLVPSSGIKSDRVSIMRQAYQPGAHGVLHKHQYSEQFYVVLSGTAILQGGDRKETLGPGDVAKIPPDEIHGLTVTSDVPFEYVSVSSPPSGFKPDVMEARYKEQQPGSIR